MKNRVRAVQLVTLILFAAGAALGFSYGPPVEFSGAPGEDTCYRCHREHPVNSGAGSLVIEGLPPRYRAGASYPIVVRINDDGGRRWGFEITAVADDGGPGGIFLSENPSLVRTIGPSERFGRFYATHTRSGTYPGQTGGAEWPIIWRAPSEEIGPIRFFLTGNAANNDGTDYFDHIYAANATVEGTKPTVQANLVSPADGDVLPAGESVTIRWTASTGEDAAPASASIELSLDGGLTYPTVIAANLGPAVTSFVWMVPSGLLADAARIRVTVIDTAGRAHRDENGANLRIGPVGLTELPGALVIPDEAALRTAAWADVDADGRLDVVVGRASGRPLLFHQVEGGRFVEIGEAAGLTAAGDVPALALGDFSGDGLPDLALVSGGDAVIYRNEGGLRFVDVGAPTLPSSAREHAALAWSDVDGDGRLDLLVGGSVGTRLLLNDAGGTFRDGTALSGLPGGGARAIAPGPVLAIGGADGVNLYRRADGVYHDVTPNGLSGGSIARLAWAEFTGDGVLDLFVAGAAGARILVGTEGEPDRFEEVHVGGDAGALPALRDAAPADIDSDGDTDLYLVEASGRERILRSVGIASFEDISAQFGFAGAALAGHWADADADGTPDLLSVRTRAARLLLNPRRNRGTIRLRVLTDGDGDASGADGEPDRDAIGARVRVDLDGDGDFQTGQQTALMVESAGVPILVPSPLAASVSVLVEFPSGEGRVVSLLAGAPASVLDPRAPLITSARLTQTGRGPKLVVDGEGLPSVGAILEANGVRLDGVRAPARFHGADGTTSRLVSRDPRLATLGAGAGIVIRVVDPAAGVLSAPARVQ